MRIRPLLKLLLVSPTRLRAASCCFPSSLVFVALQSKLIHALRNREPFLFSLDVRLHVRVSLTPVLNAHGGFAPPAPQTSLAFGVLRTSGWVASQRAGTRARCSLTLASPWWSTALGTSWCLRPPSAPAWLYAQSCAIESRALPCCIVIFSSGYSRAHSHIPL